MRPAVSITNIVQCCASGSERDRVITLNWLGLYAGRLDFDFEHLGGQSAQAMCKLIYDNAEELSGDTVEHFLM